MTLLIQEMANNTDSVVSVEGKKVIESRCFVCGSDSGFLVDDEMTLFREAKCLSCGASVRNSDIAHAIVKTFCEKENVSLEESVPRLHDLHIYEASATGKIHDLLKNLPNYICSEYLDGVLSGRTKKGIRCEDLTKLTFDDNKFDLVITQDVLEHIPDPMQAFFEIKRVLKSGRYHIFTVPMHEGRITVKRAEIRDNEVINMMLPIHHGDPLRSLGALVYTDFGDDIQEKLFAIGMNTELIKYSHWYSQEDITFIDDRLYQIYLKAYESKGLSSFFKYNSVILISKKAVMTFTGERYIPGRYGTLSYEHLHRYALAGEFVKGKTVLDIACGEGYGSYLLAKNAQKVIGVDISEDCVLHASEKYAPRTNLEFILGSCIDIPSGEDVFDVVVSFETIEHLAEQTKMLEEFKRVLKKDGVLLISSPNKKIYKEDDERKNKFHVKELFLDEFIDLLSSKFKHISIMGQRLTFSSHIWPSGKSIDNAGFIHYSGDDSGITSSINAPYDALYFIAVCTNSNSSINMNQVSLFTDKNDSVYEFHVRQLPNYLKQKNKHIQYIKNSISWKITAPLRKIYTIFKRQIKLIFVKKHLS
jgi:ubiquinone/menaquinone biosynthesis C-methylase UbiE